VDRPCRQQLAQGHLAELGVAPAAFQVGIARHQLAEPAKAGLPERAEPIDQRRQGHPGVALDVCEAIKPVERLAGALLDDHRDARDPVRDLGRDQVPDDAPSRPPASDIWLTQPALGQAVQQLARRHRRSLEQGAGVVKEPAHRHPATAT